MTSSLMGVQMMFVCIHLITGRTFELPAPVCLPMVKQRGVIGKSSAADAAAVTKVFVVFRGSVL